MPSPRRCAVTRPKVDRMRSTLHPQRVSTAQVHWRPRGSAQFYPRCGDILDTLIRLSLTNESALGETSAETQAVRRQSTPDLHSGSEEALTPPPSRTLYSSHSLSQVTGPLTLKLRAPEMSELLHPRMADDGPRSMPRSGCRGYGGCGHIIDRQSALRPRQPRVSPEPR